MAFKWLLIRNDTFWFKNLKNRNIRFICWGSGRIFDWLVLGALHTNAPCIIGANQIPPGGLQAGNGDSCPADFHFVELLFMLILLYLFFHRNKPCRSSHEGVVLPYLAEIQGKAIQSCRRYQKHCCCALLISIIINVLLCIFLHIKNIYGKLPKSWWFLSHPPMITLAPLSTWNFLSFFENIRAVQWPIWPRILFTQLLTICPWNNCSQGTEAKVYPSGCLQRQVFSPLQ